MPRVKSSRFKLLRQLIIYGALAVSVGLNLLLLNQKHDRGGIKVIGVIDGDTLVLDGKVRLRLRQVDAPELEFCGGQEAKQHLEALVSGQTVRTEEKILDQQGRPMALVYAGNTLINQTMLASGWVRYHSDQTSQTENLKAAAAAAKDSRLGIFSPQCYQTENRENPQCQIKGNIDKNSDKRLYYLPDCAQYKTTIVEKDLGEDWFCSEKAAQAAGFAKAATCR
jgi:endonuclease YncB( thermonuclease family)